MEYRYSCRELSTYPSYYDKLGLLNLNSLFHSLSSTWLTKNMIITQSLGLSTEPLPKTLIALISVLPLKLIQIKEAPMRR